VHGARVKRYDITLKSCRYSTGRLRWYAFVDPFFMGLKSRLVSPKPGHRVANENDIVCERYYAYSTPARLNEEQGQKEDNAFHMFLNRVVNGFLI
jgi:hypothetical protein